MPAFRIAVMVAGEIGGTLGRKWVAAGHAVAFGVTDPASDRAQALRKDLGPQVLIGDPAEALANADIVLLAVPGSAVKNVVEAHAGLLDGKVIIDATNQLVKGQAESFGERRRRTMNSLGVLQAAAPRASIYRAFANYGVQVFAEPIYNGVAADLLYCGPAEAVPAMEQLIREIGLNPVHVGGHDRIEIVDDVLALWVAASFSEDGSSRQTAIKVITR